MSTFYRLIRMVTREQKNKILELILEKVNFLEEKIDMLSMKVLRDG